MNYVRHGVFGDKIWLDASNVCQLKCQLCPTGQEESTASTVGSGLLGFDNFKTIVDGNPWIRTIELSNWGEIFLNPELAPIVRYACEKKVGLRAGNGVNLNSAEDEMLECLVKYRFRFLSVSLDGASQETYSLYRINGHFHRALDNIKKINDYKKKYRSEFPKLRWQFIVFGHNEHEIPAAREMARDLGMHFKLKLNWDSTFSPVRNKELVKKELGFDASSREAFKERYGVEHILPCLQLWFEPTINWNGKLLGCCDNWWGDFGNVFEQGLTETLKGNRFTYARQMLMGKNPERNDMPCVRCRYFHSIKRSGKPIRFLLKHIVVRIKDKIVNY